MKRLLFLLTAIVISITLSSSAQKGSRDNYTLQATGKNVTPALLKQSADVISARLKLFGIDKSEVKVIPGRNQLSVILPEKTGNQQVEGLLLSKGELSFYETYTHAEISGLIKSDNPLLTMLKSAQDNKSSDPRVGCTDGEKGKAEAYLQSAAPVKNCKLLWGNRSEKSGDCLFALKTSQDGKPLMVRSDVESVKIITGTDPGDLKIQINLNPAATKVFADATEKNLNRSIAIVIDDQVYSWPVVRSAIKEGKIEVTGNFTRNEGNYFPVVFNTPELPLDFKIMN